MFLFIGQESVCACVRVFFFSVCDVMCVSDGVGCGLVLNFGSVLGLLFVLGVDEFVGVFICFVICCVGLKLESCVVDVEQIALEQRREEREYPWVASFFPSLSYPPACASSSVWCPSRVSRARLSETLIRASCGSSDVTPRRPSFVRRGSGVVGRVLARPRTSGGRAGVRAGTVARGL